MSKMPAKKKSCFQITSVTTAQVATSITEDTESLDDPDESRTEDVSSEIFDVSRATDYGPEEVCERSSSEETLNNVGDAETPGTVSPNPVPDGQLAAATTSAPAHGGGGVAARSVAGALAQSLATTVTSVASAATPAALSSAGSAPLPATPSQPPATCSSRFRVIKLDHGSGEPYRRGRWTCMEYYERDSDSSVLSRSGDCIRHSSTLEQTAERDSGLGATGGSVVVVVASMPGTHGPDSGTDSLVAAACDPPPLGGAQPVMAAAPAGPLQGGVPAGSLGPTLPPTNVSLAQPVALGAAQPPPHFAYPQPHLLAGQTPGHSDYLQPHVALQPGPSQPAGPSAVASPPSAASFALGTGHPVPSAAAHMMAEAVAPGPGPGAPCQPVGGVVQPSMSGPPQSVPPPHVGAGGQLSAVLVGPPTAVPAVPNVPAAAAAPGVPTTSVTMPNVPAPLGQAQLSSSGSIAHAGHPLAPGTQSAPTSLPQADLSHFQTPSQPPGGQVDDTRRKSEPLPQPPLSLVADKQPAAKPPVADALANPLQLTPMNSLATSVFSIAIPVDGDEDRNPSTAFYQAFHLNTFQESKSLWDSASGGGVVAIDNKIEQAMDLVKSHLMYAVREEVEVLKEQIKELVERNSLLERENALLKSLSNNDQLSQLPAPQANPGSTSQQQAVIAQPPQPTQPPQQPNVSSA